MSHDNARPIDLSQWTERNYRKFSVRMGRMDVGGCITWDGSLNANGYGTFSFNGKSFAAHRIAWALAHGCDIPRGLTIDHLCFNRACVNPEHLDAVSASVNVDRMHQRKRRVMRELHGDTLDEIQRAAQAVAARTDDLRRLVVVAMANGSTVAHVAEAADVSRQTCYRWAEEES